MKFDRREYAKLSVQERQRYVQSIMRAAPAGMVVEITPAKRARIAKARAAREGK
jgi:hypothetical protein